MIDIENALPVTLMAGVWVSAGFLAELRACVKQKAATR
jgi:hypothetical protein